MPAPTKTKVNLRNGGSRRLILEVPKDQRGEVGDRFVRLGSQDDGEARKKDHTVIANVTQVPKEVWEHHAKRGTGKLATERFGLQVA